MADLSDPLPPPPSPSGPESGSTLTLQQVLHNLANNTAALEQFVTALMFLIGMFLIFRGLFKLKQYGEQRTMMSQGADIKAPLLYLVIGAALLYYPTLINVSLETVYNSTNILGYPNVDIVTDNSQLFTDIGRILNLIGYIAFLRGWVYLTRLGSQSNQPGTLSKALTHIIAGILLVNVFATWDIVSKTLGFT